MVPHYGCRKSKMLSRSEIIYSIINAPVDAVKIIAKKRKKRHAIMKYVSERNQTGFETSNGKESILRICVSCICHFISSAFEFHACVRVCMAVCQRQLYSKEEIKQYK